MGVGRSAETLGSDCEFRDVTRHHSVVNVQTDRQTEEKRHSQFPIITDVTRKLIYRKDDRAMRHICGCPKNFREFLTTPTATFPEFFSGLLFCYSIIIGPVQNNRLPTIRTSIGAMSCRILLLLIDHRHLWLSWHHLRFNNYTV